MKRLQSIEEKNGKDSIAKRGYFDGDDGIRKADRKEDVRREENKFLQKTNEKLMGWYGEQRPWWEGV